MSPFVNDAYMHRIENALTLYMKRQGVFFNLSARIFFSCGQIKNESYLIEFILLLNEVGVILSLLSF